MDETLDFFSKPLSQSQIESNYYASYNPISSLDSNAPIEFNITGTGEHYFQFNKSYLLIKVKVTNIDGDTLNKAGVKCYPINNLFHSIIKQIDFYMNDKFISSSYNNYAYISYLQDLMNFSSDIQSSLLTSHLWEKDTPGVFDHVNEADNVGGLNRKKQFKDNQITLAGRLHVDFFQQKNMLPNNINVRLKIILNDSKFIFMDAADSKFKFHIENAIFYVQKFKINPEFRIKMEKHLSHQNMIFPFTRSEVKTMSITSGRNMYNLENIFLGNIPTRIIFGFVESSAYYGNYINNPFNFQNLNINFLSIYVDGVAIPSQPLQPNFEKKDYTRCFLTLFEGTNSYYTENAPHINYNEYGEGYTFFAFDLTENQCEDDNYNENRNGNVKLEVRFGKPLDHNATIIMYADYNNKIEITRDRDIICNFSI